jgi:sec-independent protein translocase protein TatC
MGPLQSALPPGGELIATAVPEIFVLHLKMSFFVAIFLSSPIWLSQVWLFIAPGLYENEKKFAVPFILFGSFFFIAGAVFAHYVMFPIAVEFFSTSEARMSRSASRSRGVSFYSKVLLAAGANFQIPTVIFLLARMGLVSASFLWKNFKYAVLIIFIIAAVDSSGRRPRLMATPMVALYLFSIGVAWLVGRDRQKPRNSLSSDQRHEADRAETGRGSRRARSHRGHGTELCSSTAHRYHQSAHVAAALEVRRHRERGSAAEFRRRRLLGPALPSARREVDVLVPEVEKRFARRWKLLRDLHGVETRASSARTAV